MKIVKIENYVDTHTKGFFEVYNVKCCDLNEEEYTNNKSLYKELEMYIKSSSSKGTVLVITNNTPWGCTESEPIPDHTLLVASQSIDFCKDIEKIITEGYGNVIIKKEGKRWRPHLFIEYIKVIAMESTFLDIFSNEKTPVHIIKNYRAKNLSFGIEVPLFEE